MLSLHAHGEMVAEPYLHGMDEWDKHLKAVLENQQEYYYFLFVNEVAEHKAVASVCLHDSGEREGYRSETELYQYLLDCSDEHELDLG